MAFLWVIIYLVAGFGACWISVQEGLYIKNQIAIKFGMRADDVYREFMCKTQFIPQTESANLIVLMGFLAFIALWILWPLFTIGGGIHEWFVYKRVDKVWSERLEIE